MVETLREHAAIVKFIIETLRARYLLRKTTEWSIELNLIKIKIIVSI